MSYQLNFEIELSDEYKTFARNFKHAETELLEHIWCRCEGCGRQGYEHNFEFSEGAADFTDAPYGSINNDGFSSKEADEWTCGDCHSAVEVGVVPTGADMDEFVDTLDQFTVRNLI